VLRGEATETNVTVFGLTRSRLELTIYRTRGEQANQYTAEAIIKRYNKNIEITS
jgi:uncharacterized protein with gpF-like domain